MEEAIAQQFAEITRVEVVDEEISQFKREHQFVGKCVNLLIEAGSFITVATHIFPSGRDGWTRDEAVIGGHLVRLYKLISVILDQTCQDRRETAFIASRLHFETIVNLFFPHRA